MNQATIYVVVRKRMNCCFSGDNLVARAFTTKPSIRAGELAVKLKLKFPDEAFDDVVAQTVDVPLSAINRASEVSVE